MVDDELNARTHREGLVDKRLPMVQEIGVRVGQTANAVSATDYP